MHIQFVTRGQLESALYFVNEYFGNNITFSKFVEASPGYFMVTLRVIDKNKDGHTKTVFGEKLPTACHHVHMAFFLELPDEAEVLDGEHWWGRKDMEFLGKRPKYMCDCESLTQTRYVPKQDR